MRKINILLKILSIKNIQNMAFFNKKISNKFGQKCCRYNQNGIPLNKKTVEKIY